MSPVRRKLVGGVGGVIILVAAALLLLNVSGFCFSEKRYLADAEFIERALNYQARSIKELAGDDSRDAIASYLKNSPGCCRIEGSFFMDNTLLDKLFGLKMTWVRIIHRLPDDKAAFSPADGAYYEAYIELDCCGRPIRVTGMRITETQAKSL